MKCNKQLLLVTILLICLTACLGGPKQRKQKADQQLFSQAQKAFEARDYIDAIDLYQHFIDSYPHSKIFTIALQRLGESFEGLLETEYTRRIESGESAGTVLKQFLSQYGHYECWEESAAGLSYNLTHYKTILEKYPDSPIADEAAYRSIVWQTDYRGQPEGLLAELEQLEKILEQYPTTSLRHEILYKMAHRCHILHELYSFSYNPRVKDRARAGQYHTKTLYLYRLALNSPSHTKYSQKAWEGLKALESGTRIYLRE